MKITTHVLQPITGQYYTITLNDKEQYDGEIKSTIAISFHDENHRTSAADYWKYWLAQQNDANDAKAVELGKQIINNMVICFCNTYYRYSSIYRHTHR